MTANERFSQDLKPPEDNKFVLDRAYALMAKRKFTQVADDLINEIDRAVRQLVADRVNKNVQTGKTVR